jgi:hypothetical protein
MEKIDFDRAPAGSTHYDPVSSNYLLQLPGCSLVWLLGTGWNSHGGQYPDDLSHGSTVIIPLPQKQPKPWSGAGLPPVGTECEVLCGSNPAVYAPVVIVGNDNDRAVYRYTQIQSQAKYGSDAQLKVDDLWVFRPILTPEQAALDARRTRFEFWVRANVADSPSMLFRRGSGSINGESQYINESVESFWIGYNAALDGIEVELPAKHHPTVVEDADWHNTRNKTIEVCRRAIEAAGLKVKS